MLCLLLLLLLQGQPLMCTGIADDCAWSGEPLLQ
jgi:hypothetical protein